jgi:hypothetical protein
MSSRLPGWEVVQLAVHQTLDLIILVRVQASQPIFLNPKHNTAEGKKRNGVPEPAHPTLNLVNLSVTSSEVVNATH